MCIRDRKDRKRERYDRLCNKYSRQYKYYINLFYISTMDYDNWLVWQEHDHRGWNEPGHTCMHCEKPIDRKGYCSNACFEADLM